MIVNIENKIRNSSIQSENREQLLSLLNELKGEIEKLSSEDQHEKLSSVGSFAEAGANEVARDGGSKSILDIALHGLSESVKEFEESHPKLVQTINSICTQLSNSGL